MVMFVVLTLLLILAVTAYWGTPVRPWVRNLTRRRHPFVSDGGKIEALEAEAWQARLAPAAETIARIERELDRLRPPCTDESHEHIEVMTFASDRPVRRICQAEAREDLRRAIADAEQVAVDLVASGIDSTGRSYATREQYERYRAAITRAENAKAFLREAYDREARIIRLPHTKPIVVGYGGHVEGMPWPR